MFDFYFNRRDFLRMGSVGAGMSAMGLSDIALAEAEDLELKDKTVVWLWLGGGPTQFETFHAPTDFNVPSQFRPVNGLLLEGIINLVLIPLIHDFTIDERQFQSEFYHFLWHTARIQHRLCFRQFAMEYFIHDPRFSNLAIR